MASMPMQRRLLRVDRNITSPTFIEILERWAKGKPDKVVAWRVEQIPAVCRVDVEENAGDDNRFFFQKLFKER